MRIGLGMGSNMGDRLGHLREARTRVLALPGVNGLVCLCAPLYETAPVDCPPGTEAFLNTVIEIDAWDSLPPGTLLTALREIERELGRPSRYPRNTPRPVDLDILYAGDLALETPALTLPHPRLARRRFVLEPLAAIRPELILPGLGKPVGQLLRELNGSAGVRPFAPKW